MTIMATAYTILTTVATENTMIITSRKAPCEAKGIVGGGLVIGVSATVWACFVPLVSVVVGVRLALFINRAFSTLIVNMHHGWRLLEFGLVVLLSLLHWLAVPSQDDCSTSSCFRSRCPSASRFQALGDLA